jgi:hypothetical protein
MRVALFSPKFGKKLTDNKCATRGVWRPTAAAYAVAAARKLH